MEYIFRDSNMASANCQVSLITTRFPNTTKLRFPQPPPSTAMSSLSLAPFSSSSTLPQLRSLYILHHHYINQKRRIRCKAGLVHDAPFVAAIGACVLNSVVFPLPMGPNDDEDSDSIIDSADARFAVMGIISFIPYFNWMSWVFAWMDTGDSRYAVYAIVYLAPYLRSNLSLSPDESWLPIASILLCILHIQLEASIKNGDIYNLPLLKGKKEISISKEEIRKDERKLTSGNDEPRNKIRDWGIPKKHTGQVDHLDEEGKRD